VPSFLYCYWRNPAGLKSDVSFVIAPGFCHAERVEQNAENKYFPCRDPGRTVAVFGFGYGVRNADHLN